MNRYHILKSYIIKQLPAILSLVFLFLAGVYLYLLAHPGDNTLPDSGTSGLTYEKAVVTELISDSCEPDITAEHSPRGIQTFYAKVSSGNYADQILLVENLIGPIYGTMLSEGDSFIVCISNLGDGMTRATVYEYNRSPGVLLFVLLFFLITVLVGRKTGAKSLFGLVITILALLVVYLPLLFLGWPTLYTTLLVCAWITCTVFLILSGWQKKTLCAILGTLSGILFATLFALASQSVLRITGYRQEYAEALLQLRQSNESTIQIRNLLVAGVMISSLGAVMDVAMSISSSMKELTDVGNNLTVKQLFFSGMNIGRDMVGTMTNTLILAILGSGLMLILYISSLELPIRQFLSSPYLAIELISGLASSVGVILAVPLTAAISAFLYGRKEKN